MTGHDDVDPEHALLTPKNSTNLQRRSVAALGSSLPLPSARRPGALGVQTPSDLSSTRRTPSTQGPLGRYRSLSRTVSTPLRDDVQLGKRSFSSTGLSEATGGTPSVTHTPRVGVKRPLAGSHSAFVPRTGRNISHELDPLHTPLSRSRTVSGESQVASPLTDSYELDMLRSEFDRRIQSEQQAYRTLEAQMRSQSRELEALKCQRVEVLQEWEAERASFQEKQDMWDRTKTTLDNQIVDLRAETLRLRASSDDWQDKCRTVESDAHATTSKLEFKLVQTQSDLALTQSQVQRLTDTNDSLRTRVSELESASTLPKPVSSSGESEDITLLKDQLSQQIISVQRLEAANVRLKAENARLLEASARMEVLRENNRSLEAKIERLETLNESLREKDQTLSALEEEKAQWHTTLARGIASDEHAAFVAAANLGESVPTVEAPASLTPEMLPSYISTLRGTIMGLHARIEGIGKSSEQLRTSNLELSRQAVQGSEMETQLRSQLAERTDLLRRAERTRDIQADELQRCKDLLASFEEEASQGASYDQSHKLQVSRLEERVSGLQSECASLQDQLHTAQQAASATMSSITPPSHDHDALLQSKQALANLEAQYKELEIQAHQLGLENESLWLRVGRGEFDQSKERCLVLTDNPVSRDYAIRSSMLEALKKENKGLLEQVESLHKQLAEAGQAPVASSSSDALVPLQTVENLQAELSHLQETIQLKDKGMLRLKQVFTAKANEFREAVQSLFGYKVRFLENGKVKLTSAYARGARVTTLVFRSEEGNVGEMKLQGEANEGMANVAHLRDYWLSDGIRHSVPCFLAALNVELYENTTQAIRGSFGDEVE